MATILCIDDNKNVLELHKAFLEGYGHAVLVAANGASGIALSRNHAIDAIVLDFNMPGLDGGRVAEILAKEQPTVPVLICSGRTDEIPEPLRWFADAVVEKADGPDVLLSTLAKLVDRKVVPRQVSAHGKASLLGHPVALSLKGLTDLAERYGKAVLPLALDVTHLDQVKSAVAQANEH